MVLTLAKRPHITITLGPGDEGKLVDVANRKGKNAWVFNYAHPVDLESNGHYSKIVC